MPRSLFVLVFPSPFKERGTIVFGTRCADASMGSFSFREKVRMREERIGFLVGSPHPSPLPEGEGMTLPNAKICAEQYWGEGQGEGGVVILRLRTTTHSHKYELHSD